MKTPRIRTIYKSGKLVYNNRTLYYKAILKKESHDKVLYYLKTDKNQIFSWEESSAPRELVIKFTKRSV